jgi:CheY-like chemotaxis protein
LQQVFLNLLVNARDAVNGKGRIKAKTRILDSTAIPDDLFPLLSTSRFVCVSIEDNGCGMQESVLSRIFEPYFTTKPKDRGTGLGLSVVHRIVQSHRGQIDVHSTPGHGTRFDLFYPLAAETEPAPTGSAPAHSTPCTGHILIVDDEPMVGTLMRTVLESRGYRTRLAHEPAEGIAAVRTATRPFDLAIVDYAMPDMTGDRCLKEMRRHDPRLRAIMVTGHGNGEEGVRSAQCEVVYKPFDINKLLEVIARLMPTEA